MDISFLPKELRTSAIEVIERCILSREFFIREVLGVEQIESWQLDTIRALDRGETKLSIRSGHGVGKTCMCSWLALHFVLFRDDVKVIVTSPSFKQMTDGLIPEISKWVSRLPSWMASQVEITSDRLTRLPNSKNNFISFRTARKENPEALAGVHAENVMIIVDEASGVAEVIYETGQGALSTKGAIAILIGNPTVPSGFFYKTQTSLSDLWWTKKVSCYDSDRVDQGYIDSQMRTYGAESPQFRVRVQGEFPDTGADAVIPRAFVEAAIDRDVGYLSGRERIWGVDPGRGGDPTGFVDRSDNVLMFAEELRYSDLMRVVGWVKSRWDATRPEERPSLICVDSIGLGAGVADRLMEQNLPVMHVNVSESAAAKDRFLRLRAEIWFAMREWFERKDVRIEPDIALLEKLIDELCQVESVNTSSGKTDIESKEKMKIRGVPSPNIADALALTFAAGGAAQIGSYHGNVWDAVDTSKYRAPGLV